jgi:hypothetical protein
MKGELRIEKEVTPKMMRCGAGPCPAVFESNNDSFLIIGKKISGHELGIQNRINSDEVLIEVPKKLIDEKL